MLADNSDRTIARLLNEGRPEALLREHFEVERSLASRLRHAGRDERLAIYGSVYSELFDRIVDHPQTRENAEIRAAQIENQLGTIRNMFPKIGDFLEIGAGDAHLACSIAPQARHVVAVDVTDALFPCEIPSNVQKLLSDGIHIDLADATIDLAYSYQVLEHLHPEDARAHLREVWRVLRPGGAYYCVTPNRYSGPHDISVYFASTPQGFHLREYSYGELADEMRGAGFCSCEPRLVRRTSSTRVPLAVAKMLESSATALESVFGRRIRFVPKLRAALGIHMVGIK